MKKEQQFKEKKKKREVSMYEMMTYKTPELIRVEKALEKLQRLIN